MVTGPDGVKTKKYVKKTSYRCDLDANGRKLRQPGLPFVRMTADDRVLMTVLMGGGLLQTFLRVKRGRGQAVYALG